MAKLFNKGQLYKIRLEVNKDELLKDIRDIKKEVKEIVKECEYEINKLELKRKDVLIVKLNYILKQDDAKQIEKQLKKKLHRKILVLNQGIDLGIIQR